MAGGWCGTEVIKMWYTDISEYLTVHIHTVCDTTKTYIQIKLCLSFSVL